mmetsp:Transcript_60713/g.159639  ORF Transcript_60713/g.159639 Transcript_60713/m.159639 type:complete len:512 (+) Transcript_60713:647-2182(+)
MRQRLHERRQVLPELRRPETTKAGDEPGGGQQHRGLRGALVAALLADGDPHAGGLRRQRAGHARRGLAPGLAPRRGKKEYAYMLAAVFRGAAREAEEDVGGNAHVRSAVVQAFRARPQQPDDPNYDLHQPQHGGAAVRHHHDPVRVGLGSRHEPARLPPSRDDHQRLLLDLGLHPVLHHGLLHRGGGGAGPGEDLRPLPEDLVRARLPHVLVRLDGHHPRGGRRHESREVRHAAPLDPHPRHDATAPGGATAKDAGDGVVRVEVGRVPLRDHGHGRHCRRPPRRPLHRVQLYIPRPLRADRHRLLLDGRHDHDWERGPPVLGALRDAPVRHHLPLDHVHVHRGERGGVRVQLRRAHLQHLRASHQHVDNLHAHLDHLLGHGELPAGEGGREHEHPAAQQVPAGVRRAEEHRGSGAEAGGTAAEEGRRGPERQGRAHPGAPLPKIALRAALRPLREALGVPPSLLRLDLDRRALGQAALRGRAGLLDPPPGRRALQGGQPLRPRLLDHQRRR